MIDAVAFDTKPYDRESLEKASAGNGITWRFLEPRLTTETAVLAKGAHTACIFVNDRADRPCLEILALQGRKSELIRRHLVEPDAAQEISAQLEACGHDEIAFYRAHNRLEALIKVNAV